MNGEQGPVSWHNPCNGDTERIAQDAANWFDMMARGAGYVKSSDRDPDTMNDPAMD